MAYRRRQGITRASTFKEEIYLRPEDDSDNNDTKRSNMLKPSYTFHSSSSLAAQAIKASAAHRESSLSSADGGDSSPQRSKVFDAYEDSSARSDSKGFWGVLARKAKAILEEDNMSSQLGTPDRTMFQISETSVDGQEGRTIVENKTADIIQETRKLQIMRKGSSSEAQNQAFEAINSQQQPMKHHQQNQMNHETQLKASRDVRC